MESLTLVVNYILEGEFPKEFTTGQRRKLIKQASTFLWLEGSLYQRGKDLVCRRVPSTNEIPKILKGLHEEACGGHFSHELTLKKVLLAGYVWPSMYADVQHWCRSCHNCQVNGNKKLLYDPRQAVIANGPFEKWGIDAMGPLPRTANGKLYILVAIDYMTRWVEAQSVAKVNEKTVSKFVYTHICCRFGTPLEIVSDNGPGFRRGLLTEVCEELKISHRHSTPYYPQSNGSVEKANGIIARIIRKMVESRQEQSNDEAWIDRLLNLVELEWKREAAYHCYKKKALQLKDKLNEGIKDKEIKEKSLVLRYNNALDNRFDAKFERRWEGPFIVKKAFTGGYYQLMDLNGKEHPRKVNGYRLKPYLSRILPAVFETKQVSKKTKKAVIANGPFEKWGIDAMGPLPRTANGKLYILVAIDYMTRFGTPLEIVSDNGPGFRRGLLTEVCEELKISHRHSTPYYPQSNGSVEKANGIIARIIRKMVESRQEQSNDEAWIDRLLNLVELEWKREAAYHCYKKKALQLKDKLNEGIKDKEIKEKSLVLRYNNALDNRFDAKFERRWEGPFIVKKAFTGGYYQLMDLNGKEHPRKVNGYRLKPYLSRILPAVFETKQVSKKTKKGFMYLAMQNPSIVDKWGMNGIKEKVDVEPVEAPPALNKPNLKHQRINDMTRVNTDNTYLGLYKYDGGEHTTYYRCKEPLVRELTDQKRLYVFTYEENKKTELIMAYKYGHTYVNIDPKELDG
ncbi:hypothetical protein L7F22_006871 [Adiantum nelumboides]|nr:hypothetical protein [Adiantum nelumboides]